MPKDDPVKATAIRVGANIRALRLELGMTQAQLARGLSDADKDKKFSISYISAIERGKIRPSIKALDILSRRLGVAMTFLLEGNAAGIDAARAIGYQTITDGPNTIAAQSIIEAQLFIQQDKLHEAKKVLNALNPNNMTWDQALDYCQVKANLLLRQNDVEGALNLLEQARINAQKFSVEDQSRVLVMIARCYMALRQYKIALEHLIPSLKAIEEQKIINPFLIMDIYRITGNCYMKLGKFNEAEKSYQQSQMMEDITLDPLGYANWYLEIAEKYKRHNDMRMALPYLEKAHALYQMLEIFGSQAKSHAGLARTINKRRITNQQEGDIELAIQEYKNAVLLAAQSKKTALEAKCRAELAEIFLVANRFEDAIKEANLAWKLAQKSQSHTAFGSVALTLAQITNAQGEIQKSNEWFEEAIEQISKTPNRILLSEVYAAYASALEERGEKQLALNQYKKAIEMSKPN